MRRVDASPSGVEKNTGQERKQVVAGGLWIATSKFLPLVGAALLSISIGRILGPQVLGLQNYIAFVDALLATAVQWVLITVSIRVLSAARGSGDTAGAARLGWITFVLNVVGGTTSALVLLLAGLLSPTPGPWLFAALAAFLNAIAWGYGVNVIAQQGWTPVARRRLFTQLIAVGGGLVAVLAGGGIVGVFAAIALASAVFLVLMRRTWGPMHPAALRPFPPGLLRLWGQLFALEVLVQLVVQKSEVLFLQHWSDESQIAMFSVAFMVVASSAALPIALVVSGLPKVAASSGAGSINATLGRLKHPIRLALFLSLPLAALVASVGPPAVLALYGEEFATAAAMVPPMSLVLLLGTAGMVCVTFWIGADRLRAPFVAAACGVAVTVTLSITLVPSLQAWGAMWANVGGQTVMALTVLWWTHRRGGELALRPWRWVSLATVCLVVVLVMHALAEVIGHSSSGQRWVGLVLVGGLTVGLLAALGATVGYLDPRDLNWFRDSLPEPLKRPARLVTGRGPRKREESHV